MIASHSHSSATASIAANGFQTAIKRIPNGYFRTNQPRKRIKRIFASHCHAAMQEKFEKAAWRQPPEAAMSGSPPSACGVGTSERIGNGWWRQPPEAAMSGSCPPSLTLRATPSSACGVGWCLGPESNQRHADFQSAALPTELPRHKSAGPNRPGAKARGYREWAGPCPAAEICGNWGSAGLHAKKPEPPFKPHSKDQAA